MSLLLALVLTTWPTDGDALSALAAETKVASARANLRVYVDAGHGTKGRPGNRGCFCQAEDDHARLVARHLGFVLAALGFEVKLSRDGDAHPPYPRRLRSAEQWGADVIVSLHSDARGYTWPWKPFGGETSCQRNDDEPGFAVLWSEEGAAQVVERRAALGRAVGRRLGEAGFFAYDGRNYGRLYKRDTVEPSGWIDIRPTKTSVYFLRGSKTPTVIIETHHALDVAEALRWEESRTLDVFSLAVAAALLDVQPAPTAAAAP